jgi:hypothetical protein
MSKFLKLSFISFSLMMIIYFIATSFTPTTIYSEIFEIDEKDYFYIENSSYNNNKNDFKSKKNIKQPLNIKKK